jgi:ketosteroid isomerase-like protein
MPLDHSISRPFLSCISDRSMVDFSFRKISLKEIRMKTAVLAVFLLFTVPAMNASVEDDRKAVAALDTQYQAAVEKNDAATMDRILADHFILVLGSGKSYGKADLLQEARSAHRHYERQSDTDRTVRVWGDTAIVTAKLWLKGTDNGKPFEYQLWFSDTYVRTSTGWRYVFGQASLPLPLPLPKN